ncbi:MAG: hypothetical protein ACLP50_21445 [Solirubrobacteraceae bacterium]
MQRLSSLLSRHWFDHAKAADRRTGHAADLAAPKPDPKRCLNEGGHKLYR